MQCNTVQKSTLQCSAVQSSTVQHSTVQYSTVLCSTAVSHSARPVPVFCYPQPGFQSGRTAYGFLSPRERNPYAVRPSGPFKATVFCTPFAVVAIFVFYHGLMVCLLCDKCDNPMRYGLLLETCGNTMSTSNV